MVYNQKIQRRTADQLDSKIIVDKMTILFIIDYLSLLKLKTISYMLQIYNSAVSKLFDGLRVT